jgi:hypothetical protein
LVSAIPLGTAAKVIEIAVAEVGYVEKPEKDRKSVV